MKKFTMFVESDKQENEIHKVDTEKLDNGEYEIESIIDVFLEPDKIKEYVSESNANVIMNSQLNGEIKRGDKIYVVAMVIKKGTTTFSSPATQSVLVCRVVDMYSGLSYLNNIIK